MSPEGFWNKSWDRCCYLVFLIVIATGSCFAHVYLSMLNIFFGKKKREGIIFYPYAEKGSSGAYNRIQQFEKLLQSDNIPYKIAFTSQDDIAMQIYDGVRWKWYFYLLNLYWIRIFQLKEIFNYDVVVIQRGLFPFHYSLKKPLLEKLVAKINPNMVIDFWDSVFETQPVLVPLTVQYAKTVTVSNDFLKENFLRWNKNVVIWKLGFNTAEYQEKTDYEIHQPIRLVWTGLPHNLNNLDFVLPALEFIHQIHPIILVIIGREKPAFTSIPIEHHLWNANTFFDLLNGADIGIYPEKNSVHAKGKSAMKVMDYLTTGLPTIGVEYGLLAEAKHLENIYIANSVEDWKTGLQLLITDKKLREKIGTNGRQTVIENYSLNENYKSLKSILFEQ